MAIEVAKRVKKINWQRSKIQLKKRERRPSREPSAVLGGEIHLLVTAPPGGGGNPDEKKKD